MKKVPPRFLVFAATLLLAPFPMQGQNNNKKNNNNNNANRAQPRQSAPSSPRMSSPRAPQQRSAPQRAPQRPSSAQRSAPQQRSAPSRPTVNRSAPSRQPSVVQRQAPKAPQRQASAPNRAPQRPAASNNNNNNRKPEARPVARQSSPPSSAPRISSAPAPRPSAKPSAKPSNNNNKAKGPSNAPKPSSNIARKPDSDNRPKPSANTPSRPSSAAPRGPVAAAPKPAAGKSENRANANNNRPDNRPDNRANDKNRAGNDRPKAAPKPSSAIAKGSAPAASPRGSVAANAPRPGGDNNKRDEARRPNADRRPNNAPRPSEGVTKKLAGNYSPRGTVAPNRPNAGANRDNRPGSANRPNAGSNDARRAANLADNRAVNNMSPRGYINQPTRSATRYDQNRYRPGQVRPLAYRQPINRPVDNRWTRGYSVWRPDYQTSQYRSRYYSSNFIYSVNYAYRPSVWGTRPWWGARHHHTWHNGCWDYGWNNHWSNRYRYYSRPASYYPPGYRSYYAGPSAIIPWGLAAWSLGSLAYDSGYYSYSNPYYAPPVQTRTTVINYSEPITVAATRYEPASEEVALSNAEKSTAALERSRDAFRAADYLGAISAVDEAISWEPGDAALHEYRALVLFALGRYGDAAGVLNPVLASGPGWDWDTMIGLYDSVDRYTEQFRKLEDYVLSQGDAADAHFLLGYHYMVGGHLEDAYAMFDRVHELQPRDTVANQLRALVGDSIPTDEPLLEETGGTEMAEVKKAPIEKTALQGIWKAASADGKTITLSMTDINTFSWSYEGADAVEVLKGDWSIDEDGFLVLADEDVQLVGDITLNEDGTLHFLLAGSPEGDPGLTFSRQ